MSKRRVTHRRPADGPDPELVELLREAHRPPDAPDYWDGLEARIMAHVRTARDGAERAMAPAVEWWQVMGGWVGAGTWAAAVAALLAAASLLQWRAAERQVAFAAVLEATTVVPAAPDAPPPGVPATEVAPGAGSAREAALRHVLAPR